MTPRTRAEERDLLQRRITESGLSSAHFAELVVWREPRTVRRWLSLESPIPRLVMGKLEQPRRAPWP